MPSKSDKCPNAGTDAGCFCTGACKGIKKVDDKGWKVVEHVAKIVVSDGKTHELVYEYNGCQCDECGYWRKALQQEQD